MSRLSKEQEAFLGQLDAMLMMIDRYGSLASLDGFNYTVSPMKLLLSILKRFGVGYDEIVEWLSSKIIYLTPILEIAVKGVLLTKLKKNIDCNLDPSIPYYFRESIGGCEENAFDGNFLFDKHGIEIDLNSIDYYELLFNSPMSDRSHYNYFGTKCFYTSSQMNDEKFYNYEEIVKACQKEGIDSSTITKTAEIDSVYELVRAKDMNAFLWFVLHKAKFLNSKDIRSDLNLIKSDNDSVIKTLRGVSNEVVPLGQVYHQTSSSGITSNGIKYSVIGLCIKSTYNSTNDGDVKETSTSFSDTSDTTNEEVATQIQKNKNNNSSCNYCIVPTTNVWNGINWYVDRSRYFDFYDKRERNYDNEFALFRLATQIKNDKVTDKLIFTIKPSPTIIKPNIGVEITFKNLENKKKLDIKYSGDTPWSFHKIVFDSDGKMDHNGKYSVVIDKDSETIDGQYTSYNVKNINNNESIDSIKLVLNKTSGGYFLDSPSGDDIKSVLYECYPGLTVYEFNYDFVMGVKLFDPTVISARLIEELTNISLGLSYKKNTTSYKMRISEVVKKIVETNGYSSSDCFYTFSNNEYDSMLEESELKRANLYPFQDEKHKAINVGYSDVYGVLNEFDSNATLEENVSVINRALTQASAVISEEALPEDKYSLELNFITKAIEMLTSILVESLITPKLLLILLINKKMMGEELPKKWSIEDILRTFSDIITNIVNQIHDMILKALIDFVMEKIEDVLSGVVKILSMEQIEYYARLMSLMLKACSFKLPKNPNLASSLDNVDYADIDENDKPVTNEC
jgi:hypothetical protein